MSSLQQDPICVLKFGSSVLRSEADLAGVVHGVYGEWRRGHRLIVVASAIGSTTDDLLAQARQLTAEPDPRDLAKLLATGESSSAALLNLALRRAGIPSRLIAPEDIGLTTEGGHLDAHPIGLHSSAIEREFERAPVLVLPGFISRRTDGDLALLGRGGSDLTAIFVAGKLAPLAAGTRCVLVKDVNGLFEWDPAETSQNTPRRFAQASYGDALELPGDVVQHKAIRMAREFGLHFEVGDLASIGSVGSVPQGKGQRPTSVGPAGSCFDLQERRRYTRLRVGIAGHGTVGAGVLEHLLRTPDDFEVVGVLVRDLERHRTALADTDTGTAAEERFEGLFTDDEQAFFARPLDVFVELVGGLQPASAWVRRALQSGIDVVTANKALMAAHGNDLRQVAQAARVALSCSASVGGAAPLLEAATRISRDAAVRGFEAVLNGTSNYLMEALARGTSFADALQDAQQRGYAEADPRLDLDGTDTRQKVELLARECFGADVKLRWGVNRGVTDVPASLFEAARCSRGTLRIVASCYLEESKDSQEAPCASVQVAPVVLPASHALAGVAGAGAGVVFDFVADGAQRAFVGGEGAGRWPTAEAVFADLLELRHASSRHVAGSP